jgi:hypothetical protein
MKYFSYHPENGFNLHETEEKAKQAAQNNLDYERDMACDGWSDDVHSICWGEVKQHIVETMSRPRTDEDIYVSDDLVTITNYGLVDVNAELTTDKHDNVSRAPVERRVRQGFIVFIP